MTAPEGPFLYDEGPEQLHTGMPRRSRALLLWVFGGTVLVAVLMVVLLPLVKGSAADQSRDVVRVFLAALDKGDDRTAYQLLCEQERADLRQEDVAGRYLAGKHGGTVGSVTEGEQDGTVVERVRVDWPGGASSEFTVVNADGPHVCGVR